MEVAEKIRKRGRLAPWDDDWTEHELRFHRQEVNEILKRHVKLLKAEKKIKRVFVPLCGKTVDMKWLCDEGYTVVGLDGVKRAVEEFYSENGFDWVEEEAVSMGPGCYELRATQGDSKMYSGDIMLFNRSVAGQFDFIWDRAAIVALSRDDVKKYASIMKDVLCPGGSLLLESVEYDVAIMEGCTYIPPPFPMYEDELNFLFQPECTVKFLETETGLLKGKDYVMAYYLITKKEKHEIPA